MPWLCLFLFVPMLLHGQSRFRSDEQVVFFPSAGAQVEQGTAWEIEINGIWFEPDQRPLITRLLARAMGLDMKTMNPSELSIFTERTRLFLTDNERWKKVWVRVGDTRYPVGRSKANGHFGGFIKVPAEKLPDYLTFHFERNDNDLDPIKGKVFLLKEEGISVISDIDDTIKVSHVTDRRALIQQTFLKPFVPVPGMPEVYQHWKTNTGAHFHYLSASPWQLYTPLADFVVTNNFPEGTFHLKHFRWKDRNALSLLTSPTKYKPGVIEPLFQRFPKRKFVLVGDSGEADPEIYADLARKYEKQVVRILIRNTTDEGRLSDRYKETFKNLPDELCVIFDDPGTIKHLIP